MDRRYVYYEGGGGADEGGRGWAGSNALPPPQDISRHPPHKIFHAPLSLQHRIVMHHTCTLTLIQIISHILSILLLPFTVCYLFK